MSNSVNKVILVGRLGKDPELKHTQSGTAVSHFTVATDETWKDQSGQKQQRTEWHNIVAWSKLAEICGEFLKKGRLVYLEGRLQTRTWKDQQGEEHKAVEIKANEMVMLGSADEAKKKAVASGSDTDVEITDDDVPF